MDTIEQLEQLRQYLGTNNWVNRQPSWEECCLATAMYDLNVMELGEIISEALMDLYPDFEGDYVDWNDLPTTTLADVYRVIERAKELVWTD